jgi:formate hydrogenlyase transcriptional activator
MEKSLSTPRDQGLSHTSDAGFLGFARHLSQYENPQQLLQALPSTLHSLVPANTLVVVLHEHHSGHIDYVAIDKQGRKLQNLPDAFAQRTSAWFRVYENQSSMLISSLSEVTEFPDCAQWFISHGNQSLYILPLSTSLRRLGAICVARAGEGGFSEQDLSLLTLGADHAALALDDRLNFIASEKAHRQLEDERAKLKLILDLNNSVVSNLEPKQLLHDISPCIRELLHLDAVALLLPDNGKLGLYAFDFPKDKGHIPPGTVFSEDGLPGMVYRTGKPWIGDVDESSTADFEASLAAKEGFKTLCLLPLTRRGQVLGVLSVARLRKDPFTEQDIDFLMQIAGQIAVAIDNALAYRKITELSNKLAQEKLYLEDEIRTELNFEEIVGNSSVLRRVLRQVEAVAPTDSTVLIYGETGSGKELIARAVHNLSQRKSHGFVKLNCAAIPTGLLESELFGHEKGAFTGAIAQRIGRFELASEGTIFLDEVGEIPLDLQPKLLRVLQEREFERLGSSRTLRTDARLVAATNRDLSAMVESQKFRSDLFYRLNVFPIYVPPLRERTEDIPFLVRHFAQHFARLMKKQIDTISSETMHAIVRYPWPGNIRELQNVIERAIILSSGKELKVPIADLKSKSVENGNSNGIVTLEEIERRHILYVLNQTNWVFSGPNGAAARLGMKRPTLQFRMRKLGISRPNTP